MREDRELEVPVFSVFRIVEKNAEIWLTIYRDIDRILSNNASVGGVVG